MLNGDGPGCQTGSNVLCCVWLGFWIKKSEYGSIIEMVGPVPESVLGGKQDALIGLMFGTVCIYI